MNRRLTALADVGPVWLAAGWWGMAGHELVPGRRRVVDSGRGATDAEMEAGFTAARLPSRESWQNARGFSMPAAA
jgi:hypothetical protein